jgi:hypothetical protein
MAIELGFAKKLPRTLDDETYELFNLGNGEKMASIDNESSKRDASKDNV